MALAFIAEEDDQLRIQMIRVCVSDRQTYQPL
jgi:hypothetical protein